MTEYWKRERPTNEGFYWIWNDDEDHQKPTVIWIYKLYLLKDIQLTTNVSGAPNLNGAYWNNTYFLGPILCPIETTPKPPKLL